MFVTLGQEAPVHTGVFWCGYHLVASGLVIFPTLSLREMYDPSWRWTVVIPPYLHPLRYTRSHSISGHKFHYSSEDCICKPIHVHKNLSMNNTGSILMEPLATFRCSFPSFRGHRDYLGRCSDLCLDITSHHSNRKTVLSCVKIRGQFQDFSLFSKVLCESKSFCYFRNLKLLWILSPAFLYLSGDAEYENSGVLLQSSAPQASQYRG